MSYETFHKIRQLDNGDFLVTTKCSNDDAPPHEWTMDYYSRTFPGLNNEQREALFVLSGIYYGNVYYPEKYKRLEKIATEYSRAIFEATGDYPYGHTNCPMSLEQYKRELEYMREHPSSYMSEEIRDDPERSYADYVLFVNDRLLKMVNSFIEYKRNYQPEPKIKAKIQLNTGYYVSKLTANSRQIKLVEDEQDAHIFNMAQSELDKLMKRIPARLEPQIIYVKGRAA